MRAWMTLTAGLLIASAGETCVFAAEYVNGYTHVLPSYHLTPPVLYPAPHMLYPAPVVMTVPPLVPVYATHPGVTIYEPAFLHTTVVPYDPVWPLVTPGLPVQHVQQRIRSTPRKTEYTVKTFGPAGFSRQEYEVKATRRGVKIELD